MRRRTTSDDDSGHPRQRGPARRERSGVARAVEGWAADESGSASIEYLMVTLACGLLVAIGLIATIGPSLVTMWSVRRACLYDSVCLSPLRR
jgi:Flp pilus assembly pilin Flp